MTNPISTKKTASDVTLQNPVEVPVSFFSPRGIQKQESKPSEQVDNEVLANLEKNRKSVLDMANAILRERGSKDLKTQTDGTTVFLPRPNSLTMEGATAHVFVRQPNGDIGITEIVHNPEVPDSAPDEKKFKIGRLFKLKANGTTELIAPVGEKFLVINSAKDKTPQDARDLELNLLILGNRINGFMTDEGIKIENKKD